MNKCKCGNKISRHEVKDGECIICGRSLKHLRNCVEGIICCNESPDCEHSCCYPDE